VDQNWRAGGSKWVSVPTPVTRCPLVWATHSAPKAQCLWLIDPVYADESGKSPNMVLLAATSRTLGGLLDHDPNFAHRFSRSPFYTGDSPDRYIWYRQHHRIDRLSDFIREVREVADEPQHVSPRQEFSSGRELIETVKARRERAQAFRAIADEIEVEMGEETDRYNPDLIDGVLVRWINPGRAARDETAFRHALKTAHRLRAAGERMTDAAIIDAYERAYNIAQREGADGRAAEMPPMRDRQTIARRVRSYVTQGKTDSYGTPTAKYATTSQRKALATMGRRGGKKAAKRWETDPEGDYAQQQRATMKKTHRHKKMQGQATRACATVHRRGLRRHREDPHSSRDYARDGPLRGHGEASRPLPPGGRPHAGLGSHTVSNIRFPCPQGSKGEPLLRGTSGWRKPLGIYRGDWGMPRVFERQSEVRVV